MIDLDAALRAHAAAVKDPVPDLHGMLDRVVGRRRPPARWWAVAASVIAVLVLAAAITLAAVRRDRSTRATVGAGGDAVTGWVWRVTSYQMPNGSASRVPSRSAWIEFAGGQVLGDDGCNAISGPARVERQAVVFGSLGTTLVGCLFTVTPLAEVLRDRVAESVVGDRLTLRGSAGTLFCTRGARSTWTPVPPAPTGSVAPTGTGTVGGGVVSYAGTASPGRPS